MKLSTLYSATLLCCTATTVFGDGGRYGSTIHVKAGQKIQKAINSARPGSEIVVAPGTYTEQLLITKNGIRLRGQEGAILSPPSKAVRNVCTDNFGPSTQAGICIAGSGIKMDAFVAEHRRVFSVKRPVKDVSVSGFQVQGFSGANILALGAESTRIEHNKLIDGPIYGFLASGSKDTVVDGNTITSSDPAAPGLIAMCLDNFSGAYGTNNGITFYVIGLCIQTDGAQLHGNDVSYGCRLAFADPYVKGVRIYNNHLHNSYNACDALGSYGVTLAGTTNALVQGNLIEEIHNDGPAAGIYVADDPCTEGSLACSDSPGVLVVAKGNKVIGNKLESNDLDIQNDSTGSGNVFKRNRCSSSTPDGLC